MQKLLLTKTEFPKPELREGDIQVWIMYWENFPSLFIEQIRKPNRWVTQTRKWKKA